MKLVTIALFIYNQEDFVLDALKGVLSQTYSNLEVIISDDCSSDNSFQIINNELKSYSGPHKVIINRNKTNMGLVMHVNHVLSISNGDFFIFAAGDDVSQPERAVKSVNLLNKYPDASFVSFNNIVIDKLGSTIRQKSRVSFEGIREYRLNDFIGNKTLPFSGASRAIRMSVFNQFGDLSKNCPTEDTPMIVRGLLCGTGVVSSDIEIKYRQHENNLSGKKYYYDMDVESITNQYLNDAKLAFDSHIINESVYSEFTIWAQKNVEKRTLFNEFYKLSIKDRIPFYFTDILMSKTAGIKLKFVILLNFLK